MAKIKPTHCKCSNQYIDFDGTLGQCPECSPDKEIGKIQQEVLKTFTYMDTATAFKTVLNILAAEIKSRRTPTLTRLSCEESQALNPKPTSEPALSFLQKIKRLVRR